MSTRIYVVKHIDTGEQFLVEAGNPASAVRHIARQTFEVAVVKTVEMAKLIKSGVEPQKAGENAAEESAETDE